ncbi:MAG: DNA-binding protein Fis [Syntrophus sp. PtaU1.Bin005]|jgi:DNA-binding protein Fis|uniref:helix-turn-helix domain-containing protein n=1 Tax=Syntrophus TaxID=43773 RepID=UPI0009D3DCA3|nr:MAG: DNA-binding protein Fis [Syntrophus sp. PtaB.Bin138]OPY79455.1 MAG: DNA-binding protein Fis [Syntrophus sp. PtaU1.Bin005]
MNCADHHHLAAEADQEVPSSPTCVFEKILQKQFEDMATVLESRDSGRSTLYEDIMAMVERSLFRIALQRNHHVKSAASAYLGINRNTFQKKMIKLGLDSSKP